MRTAAFTHRHISRILLAWCCLLPALSAGAQLSTGLRPCSGFWRQEADLPGTYQGRAPDGDAARRVFTLDLAADGTAALTTIYIGKHDATQRGRWTKNGTQIVLTFDAMGQNQPPGPITFRHQDHQLSPIRWNPSEWGRKGPPILHRSRAKMTSSVLILEGLSASQSLAQGGI